MPPRQQQQIVLPGPEQLGALVVHGAASFVRRNKVISSAYALGLILLIVFQGGRPLTHQQHVEYNRIMDSIDLDAEAQATEDYWRARQAYDATRGWFWSCDSLCTRNQKHMQQKERVLTAVRQESAARQSDAKSVAGLFSDVGIFEVKDTFWQKFHAGKQFAKRQSMWDAMFMGIRSMSRGRDESMVEFGLKMLMQVLLNFSMGLIGALVFFVLSLWGIVRSYQANPIIAVLFFCGAAIAAFSFVVSYLLAVYGAAAGGVYALLKVGETASRGQINQDQQRQRVQYGNNRPHYD